MSFFRSVSIILIAAISFAAAGCTSSSLSRQAEEEFRKGRYIEAAERLRRENPPWLSRQLHLLELGTYYSAAGEFAKSNSAFLQTAEIDREQRERAIISLRNASAYAATLAINENLRPYRAAPFESVMLHAFLCMNYLMLGELDEARVEVRQAYALQRETLEEHEREMKRALENAQKSRLDADELIEMANSAYGGSRRVLRNAGNTYQNAFMHYLSSIIYEINGEISDAYIDAKMVYSLNPNFLPVRRDLLRFSRLLGAAEEHARWRQLFGDEMPDHLAEGEGEIILLFACGLGPVMREISITLPIPIEEHVTLAKFALPVYEGVKNPVSGARISVDGKPTPLSQPLTDIHATATQQLYDRMPAMLLRQILRRVGRLVLAEQARSKYGDVAFFLSLLVDMELERPDLRTWKSLPDELQVLRISVPAERHKLDIQLMADGRPVTIIPLKEVEVREGRFTVICLRSTGVHGTAYVRNF